MTIRTSVGGPENYALNVESNPRTRSSNSPTTNYTIYIKKAFAWLGLKKEKDQNYNIFIFAKQNSLRYEGGEKKSINIYRL